MSKSDLSKSLLRNKLNESIKNFNLSKSESTNLKMSEALKADASVLQRSRRFKRTRTSEANCSMVKRGYYPGKPFANSGL